MNKIFNFIFFMFCILFFSQMNIWSKVPKQLTFIHKLGAKYSNFKMNNPHYIVENDFLLRTKPKKAGNSWNYDLIAVGSNDDNKIDTMLFRVYKYTNKEHISNKKVLEQYLKKQFNYSLYKVTDENKLNRLYGDVKNDAIFTYIDDSFDILNLNNIFTVTDDETAFMFFSYNQNYFIYLTDLNSRMNDKSEEEVVEEVEESAETISEETDMQETKDETEDMEVETTSEEMTESKEQMSDETGDETVSKEVNEMMDEEKSDIEQAKDETTDEAVDLEASNDLTTDIVEDTTTDNVE